MLIGNLYRFLVHIHGGFVAFLPAGGLLGFACLLAIFLLCDCLSDGESWDGFVRQELSSFGNLHVTRLAGSRCLATYVKKYCFAGY